MVHYSIVMLVAVYEFPSSIQFNPSWFDSIRLNSIWFKDSHHHPSRASTVFSKPESRSQRTLNQEKQTPSLCCICDLHLNLESVACAGQCSLARLGCTMYNVQGRESHSHPYPHPHLSHVLDQTVDKPWRAGRILIRRALCCLASCFSRHKNFGP